MELINNYFWVLPLGIGAYFLLRFIRAGSLIGAFLGGTIEHEVGEIKLASGALSSHRLKVYRMRAGSGESFVGVSVVSRAAFGIHMTPDEADQRPGRAGC